METPTDNTPDFAKHFVFPKPENSKEKILPKNQADKIQLQPKESLADIVNGIDEDAVENWGELAKKIKDAQNRAEKAGEAFELTPEMDDAIKNVEFRAFAEKEAKIAKEDAQKIAETEKIIALGGIRPEKQVASAEDASIEDEVEKTVKYPRLKKLADGFVKFFGGAKYGETLAGDEKAIAEKDEAGRKLEAKLLVKKEMKAKQKEAQKDLKKLTKEGGVSLEEGAKLRAEGATKNLLAEEKAKKEIKLELQQFKKIFEQVMKENSISKSDSQEALQFFMDRTAQVTLDRIQTRPDLLKLSQKEGIAEALKKLTDENIAFLWATIGDAAKKFNPGQKPEQRKEYRQ